MARPGQGINGRRKRELAIEFIRRIRAMDRDKLHELILAQAAEGAGLRLYFWLPASGTAG